MAHELNIGDVFAVYMPKLNEYYLIQHYKIEDDKIYFVMLDCLSKNIHTIDEAKNSKFFHIDYYGFDNKKATFRFNNFDEIKDKTQFVGNFNIDVSQIENPDDIGTYTAELYQHLNIQNIIFRHRRWQTIPQDMRDRYKASMKDDNAKVSVNGKEYFANRTRSATNSLIAEIGGVEHLAMFPNISTVGLNEYVDGTLEYIENMPIVNEFRLLKNDKPVWDFTKTKLQQIIMDPTGLEKIIANKYVNYIIFHKSAPNQTVHIEQNEKVFDDEFSVVFKEHFINIPELKHYEDLHINSFDIKEIDVKQIAEIYPNVQILHIRGKFGTLKNVAYLKQLKQLRRLTISGLYGWSGEEFPNADELHENIYFEVYDIPKDAGDIIKKKYKGKGMYIKQLRTQEWISENRDNPFRDWDGREGIPQSKAKKAGTIYKEALRALISVIKYDDNTQELEEIVIAFLEAMNELDKKKQFIETIEAEEIVGAIEQLCNIAKERKLLFNENYILDLYEKHFDY